MNYITILFSLLLFGNTFIFPQSIKSYKIHSPEDETVEAGLELQPDKYLFLTRHGVFSDTLNMNWWGIFGYNSRLYVSDSNLNIEDSVDLTIPDYYTVAYKIQLIRDTIIILGRAIKTDLSEEHIFFSSFTKELDSIQTGILGIQGNYELFFDADTNFKGQIVITAISGNFEHEHHNLFIVTNNKKELISYINDSTSSGYARIHYNISSNTYHLIGSFSVSFYDTNFCKTQEKGFPFNGHFFNQFYIMPVNDYSYALQGLGFFQRNCEESGLDISYYLIDTGLSVLDSNYIYLPDSLDNAGGMDFRTTDSVFMGGTHNTNWDVTYPPQFEHENHKLVLQCSNLYTDEIYWTTMFAGNGNYMMKNLFVTSDNQCVVMSTFYDWQSNPVQERDIVLFKVNGNGVVTYSGYVNDQNQKFTSYPNPGTDRLNIKTNNNELYFELFDINGRQVIGNKKINDNKPVINTSSLKPGIYFYRLSNPETKTIETGKWIKR